MSISINNSNQVNHKQEGEIMNINQQSTPEERNIVVSTENSTHVENNLPQVCLPGNGVRDSRSNGDGISQ